MDKPERVQKLLAHAGIASRRRCEQLIREGKVTVNGTPVTIGACATLADDIRVEGRKAGFERQVYIILNKPIGITTTVYDPHAEKTVLDIVKIKERIYPVGRLDRNTEGLLLLTNDGELANHLMHPRYGVTKTYLAITNRPIAEDQLRRLSTVVIDGRKVAVTNAKLLSPTEVSVDIHEGRKHIVRNIFEKIGYPLRHLMRIRFGPLKLGRLEPGQWRELSQAEVNVLKKEAKPTFK